MVPDDTVGDELVTLVRGATFLVSGRAGTVRPDSWEGLFHRDIRVLSQLRLLVDGVAPPLLSAHRVGSSSAQQVYQLAADRFGTPTAVLLRRQSVGITFADCLEVHALAAGVDGLELTLEFASDFANLLDLKGGLRPAEAVPARATVPGVAIERGNFGIDVSLDASTAVLEPGRIRWQVSLAAGRTATTTAQFRPRWNGRPVMRVAPEPVADGAALQVETPDSRWRHSVRSALADIQALRLEAPDLGLSYVAAGAPWFMALFGRDSLLTAWQSLVAGPQMGLDVLTALARHQGTSENPSSGEQPGRILHELRTGGAGVFGRLPGEAHYGTVDAAPLFVMLAAELDRWGADPRRLRALLPAARAAVRWCVEYGDHDGDGFIEYAADATGLDNQGWKDSGNSMVHANGSQAPRPIALAEVQAYLYGAYLGLARLEERFGVAGEADGWRRRAAALRNSFRDAFWLPEHGIVAMALDGDKRPLAVASSNMGHCLWAGLLDGEPADAVASRLTQPDLTTAWGVRTLAASERAYNPMGYHLGSVWPHDSALCAAGLMRAGYREPAARLAGGLLAAAEAFDWRLPELFGGWDADVSPFPVPYPVACSPQAWSAAVPLLLLRVMLRLDPDVPAGRVHMAPLIAPDVALHIRGVRLAGSRMDLVVRGEEVEVLAMPDGLELVTEPRKESPGE